MMEIDSIAISLLNTSIEKGVSDSAAVTSSLHMVNTLIEKAEPTVLLHSSATSNVHVSNTVTKEETSGLGMVQNLNTGSTCYQPYKQISLL